MSETNFLPTFLQNDYDHAVDGLNDLFISIVQAIRYAEENNLSKEVIRRLHKSMNKVSMIMSNNFEEDGEIKNTIQMFVDES